MRDLRDAVINPQNEDYHMHSFNYSDGMATIEELVQFAGRVGLTRIAITDHSTSALTKNNYTKKVYRGFVDSWMNIHNDTEVLFGVEGDLLDHNGNICTSIQEMEGAFNILSYHPEVYVGDKSKVAEGFIRAMHEHKNRFKFIGHICLRLDDDSALRVIREANRLEIPLELDAKYFNMRPDLWHTLLDDADRFYINSDAHMLQDLRDATKQARKTIASMGYKL
jgi:histidinol phosphatase-like PHP family hydrolase